MNILSIKKFTLRVEAPRKDVVRRLAYQVEVPKPWWRSRRHRPYQGDVSSHCFNIRRIIHYRNSFLPVVRGRFEEESGVTVVPITIEIHPFIFVFASLWLIIWYGLSIPVILAGGFSREMAFLFLGMPLLIFSFFAMVCWSEANRAESDMKAILLEKPEAQKQSTLLKNLSIPLAIMLSLFLGIGGYLLWSIPKPAQVEANSPYANLQLVHDLKNVDANAIAISPNNKWVATGGSNKTIRLWDIQTGTPIKSLTSTSGVIQFLRITPDSKTVISGAEDRHIRIWDVESGQLKHQISVGSVYLSDIELSQDGKTIISTSGGGQVQAWNVETGDTEVIATDTYRKKSFGGIKFSESSYFYDIAISPDGQTLAIAEGELFLQDIKTSKHFKLSGNEYWNRIQNVQFSHDGKYIIGATERHLKIWDSQTYEPLAKILVGRWNEQIEKIDITHNGESAAVLVTQSRPNFSAQYQIWDLKNQRLLAKKSALFNNIEISSDGNYIVNGIDKYLKIWRRT